MKLPTLGRAARRPGPLPAGRAAPRLRGRARGRHGRRTARSPATPSPTTSARATCSAASRSGRAPRAPTASARAARGSRPPTRSPTPRSSRCAPGSTASCARTRRTSDLIFGDRRRSSTSSAETITLEPGDLILTGTPSGVGMALDPPRFLARRRRRPHRDRAPRRDRAWRRRRLSRPSSPTPGEARTSCRTCTSASTLLGWDRETQMPPGGGSPRAARSPRRSTRSRTSALADPAARRARRERRRPGRRRRRERRRGDRARRAPRPRARASRIPPELTAEMARATAAALPAWQEARASSEFARFQPFLERNVELRRELAACFPEAAHPYDALLDIYEPGATDGRDARRLRPLRDAGSCRWSRRSPSVPSPRRCPAPSPRPGSARSRSRSRAASATTTTPGGSTTRSTRSCPALARSDIRVTARWSEDDLDRHLRGACTRSATASTRPGSTRRSTRTTLGHGRLARHPRVAEPPVGEPGRPLARRSGPTGCPRAAGAVPAAARRRRSTAFLRAVNVVRPSLIRVEADEATYALHVDPALRARGGAHRGHARDRRRPGRLERADARAARHRGAGRRARLPAGHPLGVRRARLLPDVRARQHRLRPAVGGRARARCRISRPSSRRATAQVFWPGCARTSTATAGAWTRPSCCAVPPARSSIRSRSWTT